LASQSEQKQGSIHQQLGIAAANAVLATSLLLAPQAAVANEIKVGADPVVSSKRGRVAAAVAKMHNLGVYVSPALPAILQYDGAGVLMADARDNLSEMLLDLEQ
jgi:hypothetical protein